MHFLPLLILVVLHKLDEGCSDPLGSLLQVTQGLGQGVEQQTHYRGSDNSFELCNHPQVWNDELWRGSRELGRNMDGQGKSTSLE